MCVGQIEAQAIVELGQQVDPVVPDLPRTRVVGDAHRGPLQLDLSSHQGNLDPEQFVEHQAAASFGHLGHRFGTVDGSVGIGPIHETEPFTHLYGYGVGEPTDGHGPTQGLPHVGVDVPGVKTGAVGLGVHGHDPARPVPH